MHLADCVSRWSTIVVGVASMFNQFDNTERNHPNRYSRAMRLLLPTLIILAMSLAGCTVSEISNPLHPTEIRPGSGSLNREVDDVASGGSDVCGDCIAFEGSLTLNASGATLSASYGGSGSDATQLLGQPREFAMHASIQSPGAPLTGSGRFATDFAGWVYFLAVKPTSASITVQFRTSEGVFRASAAGTPSFQFVSDAGCPSGTLLITRFVVHLEHFGRTEVVDRHCIPVEE